MIPIDKNIPAPKTRSKRDKYPWKGMDIGDSFFVPIDQAPKTFITVCYIAGKMHDRKFSCRKEEAGYRVWRVS